MTPDSLKRLIVLVAGTLMNLVVLKFPNAKMFVDGANMLLAVFLAQSGVNAGLQKFAASRAGQDAGKVLDLVQKVHDAVIAAKASGALAAGQAAGASPGAPGAA